MRIFLLAVTFLITSCGVQNRPSQSFSIEREGYLRSIIEVLSGESPFYDATKNRNVTIRERESDSGRAMARTYMSQQFQDIGLQVNEHSFRGGANLIAEMKASDEAPVIIIGAHYDSVGNAGADDNATGIAAMMTIAEQIANEEQTFTYRFMAFDREEKGLIGSKAYAQNLRRQNKTSQVKGVFTMDMIGYDGDGDGGFHSIDCGREDSIPLTAATLDAIDIKGLPLERVEACSSRSDHGSFWNVGVPAVVISQNFFGGDNNPCYHKSCDTIDNVNFFYLGNIIEAVEEGVRLYTEQL